MGWMCVVGIIVPDGMLNSKLPPDRVWVHMSLYRFSMIVETFLLPVVALLCLADFYNLESSFADHSQDHSQGVFFIRG